MNPNRRYQAPARRLLAAIAAVLATAATTGSVLALIDSATSAPWLPAGQASLVAHCDAALAPSQRRACVQKVAHRQAALSVAVR